MKPYDKVQFIRTILGKKIFDKLQVVQTNAIIEELIVGLGCKDEAELIDLWKKSNFKVTNWTTEKAHVGLKDMRPNRKIRYIYDEFNDAYEIYAPDRLIQLYLQEGKDLKAAIDLSDVLFWENLKGLWNFVYSTSKKKRLI